MKESQLGALQNNGGQTDTRALIAGSLAINAGNNSNVPATDQRGFARIFGGKVDIGAIEFEYSCNFLITPNSQQFGSGAANVTISVTNLSGCPWTVSSIPSWITIEPIPINGNEGNGTVTRV